ncbi:hypothetical protein M408DRAFT_334218 [Serendipita vermifera MAFF 305830]|uniref:C2H2-type domain-containing protein n=1 Tax=Serendipita vermifera MAFF 305830 TaxID=933852 RepID=A0A0C3A5G4_SERVB|nr:hypothetical protein M408DRAFT_334218 [Serendipita vermifera MAFF 305830]
MADFKHPHGVYFSDQYSDNGQQFYGAVNPRASVPNRFENEWRYTIPDTPYLEPLMANPSLGNHSPVTPSMNLEHTFFDYRRQNTRYAQPEHARSTQFLGNINTSNLPFNPIADRYLQVMFCLPAPLFTVVKSWGGVEQDRIMDCILGHLGTNINNMIMQEPSQWKAILAPLAGPTGSLCSIEKQPTTRKGILSVTCNPCGLAFDQRNPVEKYAQHLINFHYGIAPFLCHECNTRFSWAQSRASHMKVHHPESSNASMPRRGSVQSRSRTSPVTPSP